MLESIGAGNGTSQEPTQQVNPNTSTIDQMIEDTISKVTAHVPQSTTTTNAFPLSQQPTSSSQFNFSTSLGNTNHFFQPDNHDYSNKPQENVTQVQKSNPTMSKNLPQDILHILESNFTTGGASDSYGGKDKEISRIAEELRVQVRLSRYRQVRDRLADSEDENAEESEDSDSDGSNHESQSGAEDDKGVEVDGSGDEDAEKIKNNRALAKLKEEIEQIIGIPEHPSNPTDAISHQEEGENSIPVTAEEANESHQEDPASGKESPDLSNGPAETGTGTSSTHVKQPTPKKSTKSEQSSSQVKKSSKKPPGKSKVKRRDDSCDESDDADEDCDTYAGPKTAHELKEPPPEVVEVPFTRVSEAELKTISPFGAITSLIGNVLVIKGTSGLGYDRVLDEGTLVCCKNGLVIGKIFETFGSVINPHYTIRLPNQIVASAGRNDQDDLNLSAGVELYYLPTHSNFVFTSEIRAQPKGTDASNLFDEEVDHAEEIEFSDDEAEAAYHRACKLAKKASANARQSQNNGNGNRRESNHPHLTEDGRRMFVKQTRAAGGKLNYNNDDHDDMVDSDYEVLQRPKANGIPPDNFNNSSTSTLVNSNNRPILNPRSKAKRRGGARVRNQNKGSSSTHQHNNNNNNNSTNNNQQHTNHSSVTYEQPVSRNTETNVNNNNNNMNGNQFFQPSSSTRLFTNHHHQQQNLIPNFNNSNKSPTTSTSNMMMIPSQSSGSSNSTSNSGGGSGIGYHQNLMNTATNFWNSSSIIPSSNNNNPMMMTGVGVANVGIIPCYNPLMPSINPLGIGISSYSNLFHHASLPTTNNNNNAPVPNFINNNNNFLPRYNLVNPASSSSSSSSSNNNNNNSNFNFNDGNGSNQNHNSFPQFNHQSFGHPHPHPPPSS